MNEYVLDWNKYIEIARRTVAEGMVLVENNGVLPLKKGSRVAVFGRIQTHYYKSGTGSGGMVNVDRVITIPEGLKNSGCVSVDEELEGIYEKWEEEHPFDEGIGWGNEPWCQEEMQHDDEMVKHVADKNEAAICIIGRTAGEDRDATDSEGSYRLTAVEDDMLRKVRKHFKRMVVLLNVGGIIDMSFVDDINPDAVMHVWQGGMIGGDGTADVLVGKVSPSGKLPDTVAYNISDIPADENFGNDNHIFYAEDIFVGYRYFETFAMNKVRYPFGYGLSYTDFEFETDVTFDGFEVNVNVKVKNTGKVSGMEVVQVYLGMPCGRLGQPSRILAGFNKTGELAPAESEMVNISFNIADFASYDDSGVTGYAYAHILETGEYKIYVGSDVRNASQAGSFIQAETKVIKQLGSALYPVCSFDRYVARDTENGVILTKEPCPVKEPDEEIRRLANLPECPETVKTGATLMDVYKGDASVDDVVAGLTDDDLCCIVRGEGMGSSRVTPGTASSFAGANDRLTDKLYVPCVCCDDGPSGMRLDSGVKAFSLPNGTLISSTFNAKLIEQLYSFTGYEMAANKVECLLGPGINIHRHPLNGRNFEYFSEDPFLTGIMGCAVINGLKKAGVTGVIKHFCANNQEHRRHFVDSVVSERALREIYLKPFEMCVKLAAADAVMTTYGSVNGLWTCGNYDLNTTILRGEWGFDGIVMSDWWAMINRRGGEPDHNDFAQMVSAGNDLYMVCADSSRNSSNDNLAEALKNGTLTRGELCACAKRILSFAVKTRAMKRLMGEDDMVSVINKPKSPDDIDMEGVEYTVINDSHYFDLSFKESKAGTNYVLPIDFAKLGRYRVRVTASSNLSIYSQNPCTLFSMGTPVGTFSFRGTGDEATVVEHEIEFYSRFSILRLFILRNGVSIRSMEFEYIGE